MNHFARDIPDRFDDQPYDPDHSSRPTQHVFDDPGQILANLPALFGFYPQDSLVMCTFNHLEGTHFRMGPSLRLDLGDGEAVEALAAAPGALSDVDSAFLFLISDRLYPADSVDPQVDHTLSRVFDVLGEAGVAVMGCWVCEEVSIGEPYHSLGITVEGVGEKWVSGHIPAITDAPLMQAWAAAGQLPELSRPEVFERFERPNPYLTDVQRFELQEFASMLAEGVKGGGRSSINASAEMVTRLSSAIKDAEKQRRGMNDLLEDTELLTRCATVLSGHRLRDAAILEVLVNPAVGAEIMLAAARSLRGQPRANALCLYALGMIAQDLPMTATPAVMSAQDEAPGHRLSLLIFEAMQTGAVEAMLFAVVNSSVKVRDGLGLPRLSLD